MGFNSQRMDCVKLSGLFLLILSTLCTVAFIRFGFSGGVPPNPDIFLQFPNSQHWLGTDSLGRDLLWRTLLGGFYSIVIGVAAGTCSLILALLLVIGVEVYFPKVSGIFIRVLDIAQSIPSFILVTLVCLLLPGSEVFKLTLSIALISWMSPFRLLRGYAKQMMKEDYIIASRALGAGPLVIARTHLILYLRSPLLHLWLVLVPQSIVYESSLSFIGLGLQSPQTSWGLLVQEGWRTMAAFPHLTFIPVVFLTLTALSLQNILDQKRIFKAGDVSRASL